ncbi:MAG: ATP-binding cassette domain-containing protein [Lachnospiraceae bacterium]|jgi:ABC-type multidrug transport system ATPase subunit
MSLIRVGEFTKSYGKKTAVSVPELSFEKGRIYAVLGANGSGKSTMARIISAADTADEGPVIAWQDDSDQENKAAPEYEEGTRTPQKIRINYSPQRPYVFRLSTERNILLGKEARPDRQRPPVGCTGRQTEGIAEYYMESLGLQKLRRKRATTLSGGEAARMALARALMKPCDLLVLDEPTAAMDEEHTLIAEYLVTEYCSLHGSAVIFITHSLSQARRIAHGAIFLHKGEMAEMGDGARVLHAPEDDRTKRFIEFYGI